MRYCFLLLFCLLNLAVSAQPGRSLLHETRYYEFHSSFWLNLHHFLYQRAKGSQAAHMEQDGLSLLDIREAEITEALNAEERLLLTSSVEYYRENVIQKSLLVDIAAWNFSLRRQEGILLDKDSIVPDSVVEVLNSVAPLYRQHFWPAHRLQNERTLALHFATIEDMEDEVIPRMAELAGGEWPELKVRVDLMTYANWAGAYTPGAGDNLFISTLDPLSQQTALVETVFHESAHLLFSRESDFRAIIYFRSKEMEVPFPRNLWHAAQFYLCGRVVQDEFRQRNREHTLMMETKSIFSNYNIPEFRKCLDRYYEGSLTLEETATALLQPVQKGLYK